MRPLSGLLREGQHQITGGKEMKGRNAVDRQVDMEVNKNEVIVDYSIAQEERAGSQHC